MARKLENPFSIQVVPSEPKEFYLQFNEDEKLVPMPVIEQDQLESIHYIIRDSGREDYAITVIW
ncbi:hypothetical protein [Brevibacillus laterosporus]|uniref:hypothetical protein n=1 Tax=Brevibacillus laterosporus TaxID=1465 RepID=UPI002158953E|nr:hypothetical protein [Brevibacillus laterosporus]MED1667041.1 hypothetical protein [Brevibacillus laterosporus]MED1671753.1 hypothetical protein [Brevibacillus laterosporus]MED1721096.1 hypothetical protein [Brevibacillus laterosporus]